MAKRNKADEPAEDEDYQFIPPDFDEDQFIHKEMVSFHTTVVLFFAGIVAAVASWGAFAAMDGARTGWFVGMVILAITFAFLRPLFRILNIDIAHWARREWIGTGFLIFFTWLAFFIMLVNPPVSDFADPQANLYVLPGHPEAGAETTLELFLHDNDAVASHTSSLVGPSGPIALTFAEAPGLDHHYEASMQFGVGDYSWTVTVEDKKGRTHTSYHNFTVAPSSLDVFIRDEGAPDDQVLVTVPGDRADYWAVYAETNGGRVYFGYDKELGTWRATEILAGWQPGANNFTIVAEEKNRFDNDLTLVPGGKLMSGPHTLFVDSAGSVEDNIPKRGNPVDPPVVNIPGLELPLLLAGLLAVAFVIRRRS